MASQAFLVGPAVRATFVAPLIAVAVLAAITLTPWRDGLGPDRGAPRWERDRWVLAPEALRAPPRHSLTIEVPDVPAAVQNEYGDQTFADMRPWPTGMVIGLHQRTDDPMVLGTPGVLDMLLSALKAALLSIAS